MMHAILEVELDVDRVARVKIVPGDLPVISVWEDMHYPLEEVRPREATAGERAEIERLIGMGRFATIEAGM